MARPALWLLLARGSLPSPAYSQQPSAILAKNTHGGFGKQYSQILKAFRKADYQGVQAAFAAFKLPPQWFGQTFGPESGPKLAAYYEREFANFVTATEKLYGSTYGAGISSIDTHARKFNPAGVPGYKPAPASLQPIPPLQYFELQYGRTPNSEVNALGHVATTPGWSDTRAPTRQPWQASVFRY